MGFLPSDSRFCSIVVGVLLIGLGACGGGAGKEDGQTAGISPKDMADALYAVMESDRTVYARHVVHRLQDQEGAVLASEHWRDDKALPLPAQMFRMGAELVAGKTDRFSYSLLSKWPVNRKNAPRTEVEIAGLDQVAEDPAKPFYGRESLGGVVIRIRL